MTTISEYERIPLLRERHNELRDLAWLRPTQLTLWVGAGFGKYYAGFPIWSEVLRELSRTISARDRAIVDQLIEDGRFAIAAEILTDIKPTIGEEVCELFRSEPAIAERIPLRKISPATVITTNYDLLLDLIYPDYRRLSPNQPIESIFSSQPRLVKIHGSISQPRSIVLNTTSYAKTYNKEFEWFLLHVLQNTTVFFLGAGLSENEPYMKFLHLLKQKDLLKHDHFALVPFERLSTVEETNKHIADYSNQLVESYGLKTLPYVVDKSDHSFFDALLASLCLPETNKMCNARIAHMEEVLKHSSAGVDEVGPMLFRAFRWMDRRHTRKTRFTNLLTKFLRELRENRRLDLISAWFSDIQKLVDHQELMSKELFNQKSDRPDAAHNYKWEEILKNKAFMFDAQRMFSTDAYRYSTDD